mmetsp:Transcript_28219/g.71950  ORF Transcript_28219/g.71950 Transcript_28219/m.71950 type:complete len:224 (+) Transcript_28219:1236-1907(+)
MRENWSKIHAMWRSSVPMSGAGTHTTGPRMCCSADTILRVSFSCSRTLSRRGSTATPPFAPPKGTSMIAVFHVLSAARLRMPSSVTSWWKMTPPLKGPRLLLCCTRCAENSSISPLSMGTGSCTVISRSGCRMDLTMPGFTLPSICSRASCTYTAVAISSYFGWSGFAWPAGRSFTSAKPRMDVVTAGRTEVICDFPRPPISCFPSVLSAICTDLLSVPEVCL